MKLPAGIALIGVLAFSLAVSGEDFSGNHPTAEQCETARRLVMKMLSERKLAKVEMERCRVRDVIEFFCVKEKGFNVSLALGDFPSTPEPAQEPLVTIHRRDMPLTEFLDEVCKQSGLKWVIDYPGLIRITPKTK